MELSRGQIIKALDWLDSLVGNSNDSDMAMFTYQLLGILFDTCEELTEKNAIQTIAAIELDKQVQRLTEEKERLEAYAEKNDSEWREIYADSQSKWEQAYEKLEAENHRLHTEKSRLIEEYEAEVKITKSDTVRKMQELIKERCIKGGIYPVLVARTIDQITKEILEENKNED